jgi:hypothetical protein
MNNELKEAIEKHCVLYNKAERVFKEMQLNILDIDTGLLNEFRYCARAQTDVLKFIAESNGDSFNSDVISAIEVANRALCCVINDSIDLVLDYAKSSVYALQEKYKDGPEDISNVYGFDNYLDFWQSVKKLEQQIAESREHRSQRLDIYYDLVGGDDLKNVKEFCFAVNIIEAQLAKIHSATQKTSRQWIASQITNLLAAASTGAAAVIAYYTYVK